MKRTGKSRRLTASKRREALQEKLGHRFRDPALLELALTHRSFGPPSQRARRHNETLEFLGDAILGFVVAEALRREAPPDVEVGLLSRTRSSLVSEASLAPRARSLGLGEALRLGKGEESTGGREKPSLLADAFEAVVAAIYLDGGMRAARAFILRQYPEGIAIARGETAEDPKTRLQEILQARGAPLPVYRVASQEGPDHDRTFTVEILLEGRVVARGAGRTKKAAGARAAREALVRMGSAPQGGRGGRKGVRENPGRAGSGRPGDGRD